jgi:hypothetical protein
MSSIVALTSSYDAYNPRFLASDAGVWMVPWLLSAEDRLPRRLTVIKTRSECSETGSDKDVMLSMTGSYHVGSGGPKFGERYRTFRSQTSKIRWSGTLTCGYTPAGPARTNQLQTTQLGFYERFCDCTSTWNIQALLAQFQKPWF